MHMNIQVYIYIYTYMYIYICVYLYIYICTYIHIYIYICPTQSMIYVHFLVHQFRKLFYVSFSTNVQILCGGSDAPGSDPPHKML